MVEVDQGESSSRIYLHQVGEEQTHSENNDDKNNNFILKNDQIAQSEEESIQINHNGHTPEEENEQTEKADGCKKDNVKNTNENDEIQCIKDDANENEILDGNSEEESKEEQNEENNEFDSKKRHYFDEFFQYEDLSRYNKILKLQDFVILVLEKKYLALDKLIVYLKLRQLNCYQVEDAQNFGVDYTLYEKPKLKEGSEEPNIQQFHFHSTYLLKIDAPFNTWLGYARIAHNVNKKMIIALIEHINESKLESIFKFHKVIQNWLLQKIGSKQNKTKEAQESLKEEEIQEQLDVESQLIELSNSFKINLISYGMSKEN